MHHSQKDQSKYRHYKDEIDNNYRTVLGTSDVSTTAFGNQKVSLDKSLLHMMWTYDVPIRGNKELIYDGASDYVEQTSFVHATSVKGALNLTSGATLNQRVQLRTLQHTRYQPNRGYLYATSIILPNPTANGVRKWGTFLPCNGVFLELVGNGSNYFLNFVVKNHWKEDRVEITKFLPEGTDISKGHLWDIQMEWRGIGNFKVYYDMKLIYVHEYIGTLDEVSIENPSLPMAFECINTGDEVVLKCGCSDISAEGGESSRRYYGSASTGTSLLPVTNVNPKGTAIIVGRLPKKISYGEVVDPNTGLPDAGGTNEVCYSRDTVLDAITTFCKDESFTIVSASRGVHLPNISELTGWTVGGDSYVEYLIGGVGSALDTAFQLDYANMNEVHASRHELDQSAVIPNPNPDTSPFFITSDTYVVVSIKPDGANKDAGCNIEFSEEI